jgi:hypothetical protein
VSAGEDLFGDGIGRAGGGGKEDADESSGAGDGNGSSGSSDPTGPASSADVGPTADASSGATTATTGSSGAGGDPGTSSGEGPGPTTTTTVATSVTTGVTTGGGSSVEIPCTNETCGPGQVCCVDKGDHDKDHCALKGSCGGGYLEVACNDSADCAPGEVCCGTSQNQSWVKVECTSYCQPNGGAWLTPLCENEPWVCPGFFNCKDSKSLPDGFSYCGQ